MSIEDDIAKQLAKLEQEESDNLDAYMKEHPEEFASTWTPTSIRWRNGSQARARNKQKQRAYQRKKERDQLAAAEISLDLSLGDGRIKRIKVYKIQVKGS